jgi:non-ribosomal peptide synthetase component E (peptide arylation enzyme)
MNRILFSLFGVIISATAVMAGQWSQYASCDSQYESDSAICRKVAKQTCWASASERLAYCNKTKGTTGTPRLVSLVPGGRYE